MFIPFAQSACSHSCILVYNYFVKTTFILEKTIFFDSKVCFTFQLNQLVSGLQSSLFRIWLHFLPLPSLISPTELIQLNFWVYNLRTPCSPDAIMPTTIVIEARSCSFTQLVRTSHKRVSHTFSVPYVNMKLKNKLVLRKTEHICFDIFFPFLQCLSSWLSPAAGQNLVRKQMAIPWKRTLGGFGEVLELWINFT